MIMMLFAQVAQIQQIDLTAIVSALGGGTGGALAVYFAMKWVAQVIADRDREKTDWLAQSAKHTSEYAELLRMVLAALRKEE